MKSLKSTKGFTLVELIVVIAILGILAAVAVPAYSGYITKAKEAAVITELDAIKTAAQAANATKGNIGNITVTASTITVEGTLADTFNTDFITFYGSTKCDAVTGADAGAGKLTLTSGTVKFSDAGKTQAVWNSSTQTWSLT